jgi:uncharacterized protein YecE (DUF72 family)
MLRLRIGTAGWSIPKQHAAAFPASGSHLERYAQRFNAVEINTSFYRPHRKTTYQRWAASVPADFRFAVKAPQEITHELRLIDANCVFDAFLAQIGGLGSKLGILLFQLPPSLAFDAASAQAFFTMLRERHGGSVVCEPRHPTWFTAQAEDLLSGFRVSRVAADPAIVPPGAEPGGHGEIAYFRLHGAPRVYYSDYGEDRIVDHAREIAGALAQASVWCIYDNTALGAATGNALALAAMLTSDRTAHPQSTAP